MDANEEQDFMLYIENSVKKLEHVQEVMNEFRDSVAQGFSLEWHKIFADNIMEQAHQMQDTSLRMQQIIQEFSCYLAFLVIRCIPSVDRYISELSLKLFV